VLYAHVGRPARAPVGSNHDCTQACCGTANCVCNECGGLCNCDGKWIMSPSSSPNLKDFSESSQIQICNRLSSFTSGGGSSCLLEPGSVTIMNKAMCGNGFREAEEECDCGGSVACNTSLCCTENCTLKAGAQCNNDTNNPCCDGESCSIIPAQRHVLCRVMDDPECDIPEYCDGESASCPADRFQPDGLPCANSPEPAVTAPNVTYCASGRCTSREVQCKVLGRAEFGSEAYTRDCARFRGYASADRIVAAGPRGGWPTDAPGPRRCLGGLALHSTCQAFCSSATAECTYFFSTFRDGTKCGDGGYCYDGVCTQPDFGT